MECDFCHMLVNPDQPVNIAGTTEAYVSPFEAYDAATGEPHFGSGQYVLNGNGTRLGPYTNAQARHTFIASPFHRQGQLCGTCHDVSNPAVGDLAHNNGAQLPLAPGSFSGVPGSPIVGKAAFNNVPYKYGIVERTFSEWTASSLDTLLVNDFNTLPADLRVPGGSLAIAYHKAFDARSNANYEDGAARTFTCQTCHMAASTGIGCNKSGVPTRTDLPMHDQTGAGHWMPDAVIWQNDQGTLRFGTGITATQRAALLAGQTRAQAMIRSAASVSAAQSGTSLVVRVTNLTGHKLISGYPEGRRMWLNVKWKDAGGALVAENGAYGPIGRTVTDRAGVSRAVQSIIDPAGTKVYEVKPGLSREWAAQLINLGYPAGMPLSFDRISDAVELTLGQLAAAAPGTEHHSFHFVLNNVVTADNRIPPYGLSYNEARLRNALPVPATQYGAPGPGGTLPVLGRGGVPDPGGSRHGRGPPLLSTDELGVHPVPLEGERWPQPLPRQRGGQPPGCLGQQGDVGAGRDRRGDGRDPRPRGGGFAAPLHVENGDHLEHGRGRHALRHAQGEPRGAQGEPLGRRCEPACARISPRRAPRMEQRPPRAEATTTSCVATVRVSRRGPTTTRPARPLPSRGATPRSAQRGDPAARTCRSARLAPAAPARQPRRGRNFAVKWGRYGGAKVISIPAIVPARSATAAQISMIRSTWLCV